MPSDIQKSYNEALAAYDLACERYERGEVSVTEVVSAREYVQSISNVLNRVPTK